MDIHLINENEVVRVTPPLGATTSGSFLWIDTSHDEIERDADGWRNQIATLSGARILDLHLLDATNLGHPSYFDSTQDYDMVVFRKLAIDEADGKPAMGMIAPRKTDRVPALAKIITRPVTFFLFDNALVTISPRGSRLIEQVRNRMVEYRAKAPETERDNGKQGLRQGRLPARPVDLMLRLLNAMVDRYLDLRQPLTDQLDRWQRELLDPRRTFHNWGALLDARIELRKLENLCEEQRDAMQEFRDNLIEQDESVSDRRNDVMLVRVNDVMEHIARVLNHTRRLQDSVESAVQLHFSATAHRTNQIVRTLTVITAVFAPLTLITGIFGMNFQVMPLLHDGYGFWTVIAAMGLIAIVLLGVFKLRRYLDTKPPRR